MASNNNTNSNRIVVPAARQALDQMKLEIANELGMANYDSLDKGNLPSRQNGYVGGYMTKRLVEMAQQNMAGGSGSTTQNFTTPNNQ
ncbi:MAG: alpha/beta-type small acid-soluble spore protein [Tissierellia bacterium]|nr:alpha/beta-type small acid-soluble spore protein [Tissierellia bacterium]MDD4725353.1 alpha/beta-type small acid-soluble spore protein [Tissierellia bacterium]